MIFIISNMETTNITQYSLSLFCFYMLISSSFIPIFAQKTCDFPAIFNFGASSSDTGGLSAAFSPLKPPYGRTYFHMPAGRYSDGRLIIDFIAESFGLPLLHPYLDSLGANFSHGANFATAGSTITRPTTKISKLKLTNPFFLDVQFDQFKQFKDRSQMIRETGRIFANLMPKEEYFSKGLYTFDIGLNDLAFGFGDDKSVEEVDASIPRIINKFLLNIKNLYNLGARSFWIHNIVPLGCLAPILVLFPLAAKDSYGCAKPYNEVVENFNLQLKNAISQLGKDFLEATFTYVDVYSVKYSLFKNPEKYGFKLPLVVCCGYGGEYNYNSTAVCGESVVVNGTNITVGSCDDLSVHVNWDGGHFTEAANKFIFDQISTGSFSDPPIPLNMSCFNNYNLIERRV